MAKITARWSFWIRIAVVASVVWIGGTYLRSLAVSGDFQFWSGSYGDEPGPALWFALVGMILIVAVCMCLPWILTAVRPRLFWTRIGTTGAVVWAGGTFLNSLLHPDWLDAYQSDNVFWFGTVGALVIFTVLSAIPWIMSDERLAGTSGVTEGLQNTSAAHDADKRRNIWGIAAQVVAFMFASAIVRSCFIMQEPHRIYAGPAAPSDLALPVIMSDNRPLTQSDRPVVANSAPMPGRNAPASENDPLHPAIAPSFDCASASNWAEKSVCSIPELADDDHEMGELYGQLISSVTDTERVALRSEQREWIASRNQCSEDTDPMACLSSAYASRLSALRTRQSEAGATSQKSTSPLATQDSEPTVAAPSVSEAPPSRAPCTAQDRQLAQIAKQNGYQYAANCE